MHQYSCVSISTRTLKFLASPIPRIWLGAKFWKNESCDTDHAPLKVICNFYAGTWCSLPVYKIWPLELQPSQRYGWCPPTFKRFTWPDCAPFGIVCHPWARSTYLRNLKSLSPPTTKIWKEIQNINDGSTVAEVMIRSQLYWFFWVTVYKKLKAVVKVVLYKTRLQDTNASTVESTIILSCQRTLPGAKCFITIHLSSSAIIATRSGRTMNEHCIEWDELSLKITDFLK